jgi:hypothetical protein
MKNDTRFILFFAVLFLFCVGFGLYDLARTIPVVNIADLPSYEDAKIKITGRIVGTVIHDHTDHPLVFNTESFVWVKFTDGTSEIIAKFGKGSGQSTRFYVQSLNINLLTGKSPGR